MSEDLIELRLTKEEASWIKDLIEVFASPYVAKESKDMALRFLEALPDD